MALLYLILLSTLLVSSDSRHLCFILYKCACSQLLCSVLNLRTPVTCSQVKSVPYCTFLTLESIFISLFCGSWAIPVYLYFVTLVSQVKIIFLFLEDSFARGFQYLEVSSVGNTTHFEHWRPGFKSLLRRPSYSLCHTNTEGLITVTD